jgi:uracil-DNA glycosylase
MWKDLILAEQEKPYFKDLLTFINHEYETKTIFPPSKDVYNAFKFCPFEDTKVVILGQDPYHNFNQAHGLCFSVLKGNEVPPSLKNMYKELEDDLHIPPAKHGELTHWAIQGVLLLNTILTVEAHKPLSHKGRGWEQFTDNVITQLDQDDNPKVFVLWGNNAKAKKSLIHNKKHLVLMSSHPSPLSARHSFFGSRPFSKINQFLVAHNREPIDWRLPD